MASETPTPDERARHVWSLGSYADITPHFLDIAARLVDAADVTAGDRVLDVACGTGNVAITAARRRADVTGLDLVPSMFEQARENAAIAGLETMNEGNFDIADEIVSSDFVMHVAGDPEPIHGPSGLKEHMQPWHTAFPDLRLDVDDVLIDGNRVIGRWTLTGTHEEEFMGIEPSGAQISIRGVEIDWVENGEIVKLWEIVDTLSLFQQLGVIDPLTE